VATLSGTYLDLITDGVPAPVDRSKVVMAVRRVMLSAHRHSIRYDKIHGLLTDDDRVLATQIAIGYGNRRMTASQVNAFLSKVWSQTAKVAAERPAWSRDDALSAIEFVRDNWQGTKALPARKRAVMDVVLDLATEHGTTRPTVPARVVADRTGIPFQTVSRLLRQLANDGEWLGLAQQGNHRTRRASLYNLAPALTRAFNENVWGASPPESHPVSTSHPSMSHGVESMSMSITVAASSAEDLRRAIQVLNNADPEQARLLFGDPDFPRLRLVATGD
jgi:hypothetical protein